MTVAEADAVMFVLNKSDKHYELIEMAKYPTIDQIKLRPFLLIHIYGQFLRLIRRMFEVAGLSDQLVWYF